MLLRKILISIQKMWGNSIILISFSSTATNTVYDLPVGAATQKRDAVTAPQPSVPTYATPACKSAGDYSSACSCWGFTAGTKIITTPTTTTIVTVHPTCS